MKRRAFLQILGGAVTALAAKPVLALVPAPAPVVTGELQTIRYLTLDEINAYAFMLHSQVFPEHGDHYRNKAMKIVAKMREKGEMRAW